MVRHAAQDRADRAQAEVNRVVEELAKICLSVIAFTVTLSSWSFSFPAMLDH